MAARPSSLLRAAAAPVKLFRCAISPRWVIRVSWVQFALVVAPCYDCNGLLRELEKSDTVAGFTALPQKVLLESVTGRAACWPQIYKWMGLSSIHAAPATTASVMYSGIFSRSSSLTGNSWVFWQIVLSERTAAACLEK